MRLSSSSGGFGLLIGLLFAATTITVAQLQRPQQLQQSVTLQAPLDQVAVDALTALYLRLENALWQVIRSGGTSAADKLRSIHETHLTFFETGFAEKNVELSRLDTDQRNLDDAIRHINLTASVVRDAYLHWNARDRKRDEAVRFAQHGVNMSQYMDKLFNLTEGKDFYHYVARKGQIQSCELGAKTIESSHQLIYSYYHDIASAELKAYAIAQLSHMFNTIYEVRNSVTAAENLRRVFQQRGARAQERVRSLLAQASREVWACDPDDPRHANGASAQVTRLLQGYVDNEVNLNEVNDCKKTCPDYQQTKNFQCFNGSHCAANADVMEPAQLRCGGDVVGCEFISADMEICHSDDPRRRYDGIKYTCGKKMGASVDTCASKKTRATSWNRWLVHCSHCFCYCDETGPHSDRYFSLQPVLSDITKNLVVTGVAIRKINRIFYWQITERPLIANAEVNTSNAAMLGVPQQPGGFALRSTFRLTDPYIADGIDYHTLNHANRSINLDLLNVPPGTVCTGVRFAVELGSLKPEIRATAFDFKTGQLSRAAADSTWVRDTIFEKTPIDGVEGAQVPTHALSKSVPDMRRNKYVEFGPSDKWSDVAQSTVPFLDTQAVRPQVEVPLTGLGLYFKGVPGFGGYVAPKVLTFDYTTHVRTM